ncbi:MAG TPA: RDD family protein [Baekduia sp.]|nr:RDD family protein [Baekduia sp.]
MTQLPEDPRTESVPPPGGTAGGYGPGGFAPPTDAFGAAAAGRDALASRWMRLAGAIIDSVIVAVPSYILAALADNSATAALYLIYLVLSVLYAPLLLSRQGADNGQTIGKQAVGIRVVHQEGGPMTFGRAALREIVGKTLLTAVTCGLYGIIDALWCLWDPRKQCLHDKVGSTFVVTADADPNIGPSLR